MARFWIIIAGLLGAAAVAMGAYHAHGLEDLLRGRAGQGLSDTEITAHLAKLMQDADTAVRYQMYHALAILVIAAVMFRSGAAAPRGLHVTAGCMLLGVLGFSGGIYLIVFDVAPSMHWIIPLGGVFLVVGWLTLALAGIFIPMAAKDSGSR